MKSSDRLSSSLSDDGRYRLLIEAVTDYAIYMLDPDGIISSWNPGAERFKGYKASEIVGQHFSRFYTKEDQVDHLPARALETAARDGKFEHEGWRVRKDGSRFWAYVVIDPIRDPSGELLGFAKITRDLTERRASEEALRQSQEQFRILVEGVTDYAIYMLSPAGLVTSWNRGAQRIKGYEPTEIIGSHFSRFYTKEDVDAGMPHKALEVAEREGRYESEGLRVRKDGTRFFASVVIDAIRDDQGQLIGLAKITRDITQQRETQARLEQTRETLVQSQKMEALGQLTGGIAHDFNNLLMAITGSLELLKKRLPEDPKSVRFLDNALQGAKRGASLTKRMLAFARRQEMKLEAVDVPELVRGMTDLLQGSLGSVVSIETRFGLGMRPVFVDPNQLEMAVLNLAVNARDAMPDGGHIVISAREVAVDDTGLIEPGAYVCLSVSDTGIGMDEETLRRATEPFFTTKGPGKGTGLGLAMIHGIAGQCGGTFQLKSRKGEGTTAELWLPVAKRNSAVSTRIHAEQETVHTRSLSILVVDDDNLVLTNTVAMLEDLGHRVTAVSSAADALAAIHEECISFDLVLADHMMPHMSGLRLIEEIRKVAPNMSAVLATGYTELEPVLAAGIPRLAKPFSQAELSACVGNVALQRPGTSRVIPLCTGNSH